MQTKECERMKKIWTTAGSCAGAFWMCFWARSLDTVIGCLYFSLGVILFAGAWISVIKDVKKDKEDP